jgi:hypothetical protein
LLYSTPLIRQKRFSFRRDIFERVSRDSAVIFTISNVKDTLEIFGSVEIQ